MSQETIHLLIPLLVGVFLVVFGNYKREQYAKLIDFGIKTEGTVLSLEISSDTDGASYFPKISYVDINGNQIIKQYQVGSNPAPYKVGDSVTIFYNVNNREEFIIEDKRSKYLGPVFILVGCSMIVFCVYEYFYSQGLN
jgi:hypothetical protein